MMNSLRKMSISQRLWLILIVAVLTLVVDHGAAGAAPQVSDEAGAEPSPAASDAALCMPGMDRSTMARSKGWRRRHSSA